MKQSLNTTQRCLSHVLLMEQQKNTGVAKTSHTYNGVVLRYGRTCSKMCGTILRRIGEHKSGPTLQIFASLFGRSSMPARSLLANCPEMLVFGTNWETRHSMVCQQICSICHQMDSSMWQTISKADFISITRMTIVNFVMWETLHSIADWVCFKTQTLLETLRTQNQPQVVSCVFLEVELSSQSVEYVRNKLRFRTALQNLNHFSGWWTTYGLLIFGTWW